MSENTSKSVSPESTTSVPDVKTVVNDLVSGASRAESGFDRLDRSAKSRVRNALDARLVESVRFGRNDGTAVVAAIDAVKGSVSVKSEIDLKVETVRFVNILRYAADALVAGKVGFDGFDPIVLDESDFTGTLPMTEEDAQTAMKLANRKITRKSPENDIAAAIRSAFANVPDGTYMKVSDIRKNMDESFMSDSSWDGRISARLFPKSGECTVEGIVPVPVGPDGKKGAKRIESDIWDTED